MKRKLLTALAIILFALGGTSLVAYEMGAFEPMPHVSPVAPRCVKMNGQMYFLANTLQNGEVLTYNTETSESMYRNVKGAAEVPCSFNQKVITRSYTPRNSYSLMGKLVEVPAGTDFFSAELQSKGSMPETTVCSTLNAMIMNTSDGFLVEVYCKQQYMGMVIPSAIANATSAIAPSPIPAATPTYTGIPKNLGDPVRFAPNTKVAIGMVFKDLYGVRMSINNKDTLLALGDMLCKVVDNWTNANLWVVRCYGTHGTDQGLMTIDQIWHAATGRGPVDWLDQPISFNDLSIAIKAGTVVYKDSDFKNAVGTYTQSIICNVQGMRWSSDSKSPWPAAYKLDCGWVHPTDLDIVVPVGIAKPQADAPQIFLPGDDDNFDYVSDDGVRLRKDHSLKAEIVTTLKKNEEVEVTGPMFYDGTRQWAPVRYHGTDGWVSIGYLMPKPLN